MNLSVQWDIKDLLQAADRMALQKYLPEFIAKTVAVSMRDLAENKARDKLGKGKFASEIAAGIRVKADGMTVTLDHASNDTNHLAEHVHEGGPVKSGNGKMLAIPIDKSVRGEWASVHRWNTPDGKPLFLRKKEDGPRGRAQWLTKSVERNEFAEARKCEPPRTHRVLCRQIASSFNFIAIQ